jgi:hypothetical protein
MDLPSSVFPKTPLFLLVDRKWRSSNAITFTFLPENETEARSVIAGLIPFFKATYSPWFLHIFFSEEAKLRHATSTRDPITKSAYSAEEAKLDGILGEDNEMLI